jgi:DNA-binding Lrp family transcriptional regulator
MGKVKKAQDNKDELKILAELQRNSKNNIETIAKHSGVSRQKAYRTIKRLEELHTIWGYTAVVDENAQGVQKFMLLLNVQINQWRRKR